MNKSAAERARKGQENVVHAATPSDWPAIERLFRESIIAAEWLPASARLDPNFSAVSLGEVVRVVKNAGDEVVGFMSVYIEESFIHHLFVAPQAQRQGIASALLASLAGWLPLPWRLKCMRENKSALAFYEATGWRGVATGESADGEHIVLEITEAPAAAVQRNSGRHHPTASVER